MRIRVIAAEENKFIREIILELILSALPKQYTKTGGEVSKFNDTVRSCRVPVGHFGAGEVNAIIDRLTKAHEEDMAEKKDQPTQNKNQFISQPEPKYFSTAIAIKFAEKFAGYSISRGRLYKYTMDKTVPHIKGPGGRLLFPIEEFKDWLEGKWQTTP